MLVYVFSFDFFFFFVNFQLILKCVKLFCLVCPYSRIFGEKVAELPLIGTSFKYRRQGMCRLFMNILETVIEWIYSSPYILIVHESWCSIQLTTRVCERSLQITKPIKPSTSNFLFVFLSSSSKPICSGLGSAT